ASPVRRLSATFGEFTPVSLGKALGTRMAASGTRQPCSGRYTRPRPVPPEKQESPSPGAIQALRAHRHSVNLPRIKREGLSTCRASSPQWLYLFHRLEITGRDRRLHVSRISRVEGFSSGGTRCLERMIERTQAGKRSTGA